MAIKINELPVTNSTPKYTTTTNSVSSALSNVPTEFKSSMKADGTYDYNSAMNNYIAQMNGQQQSTASAYDAISENMRKQSQLSMAKLSNQYADARNSSSYGYEKSRLGLKELMANQGLHNSGDNITANVSLMNQQNGEQAKLTYEEATALQGLEIELNKSIAENDLAKANKLSELKQAMLNKQMDMDTWYTEYQNTLNQQAESKRQWQLGYDNTLAQQKQAQANWEKEYELNKYNTYNRSSGGGGGGGSSASNGGTDSDVLNTIAGLRNSNQNYDTRIGSLNEYKSMLNANGVYTYDAMINSYIDEVNKAKSVFTNSKAGYKPTSTTTTKTTTTKSNQARWNKNASSGNGSSYSGGGGGKF